jgi:hypothetical protein
MKKVIFVALFGALVASCASGTSSSAVSSAASSAIASSASSAETTDANNTKGAEISGSDYDPNGGADGYSNAGDETSDMYYQHPDFYDMTSNDHLTILSHFKTFQQTTEYSCGPSAALMVLTHYGITRYTEWDLAVGMHASVDEQTNGLPGTANEFGEYGTSVGKMYNFFSTVSDIAIVDTSYKPSYSTSDLLTADEASPADVGNLPATFAEWAPYASGLDANGDPIWVDDCKNSLFVSWILGHLDNNEPIMVEWGDWDGHWQTIIGYDTMGTPSIGDDMIILADSYDTSDHWQDGYYFYPAERFFYMWKDRNIAPKPFQLQPYMVINLK